MEFFEEFTIRVKVYSTITMAVHEVEGDTPLLTRHDFGDAFAKLDGTSPEKVAG